MSENHELPAEVTAATVAVIGFLARDGKFYGEDVTEASVEDVAHKFRCIVDRAEKHEPIWDLPAGENESPYRLIDLQDLILDDRTGVRWSVPVGDMQAKHIVALLRIIARRAESGSHLLASVDLDEEL